MWRTNDKFSSDISIVRVTLEIFLNIIEATLVNV